MYTLVTPNHVYRVKANGFNHLRTAAEAVGLKVLAMWRDDPTVADLAEKFNR